ncbi:MAG: dockerin type I domain-containing protein [Clostridiales bacterium]|nr:dockerin type I domain-containing protein [Clostridiales bacterium]
MRKIKRILGLASAVCLAFSALQFSALPAMGASGVRAEGRNETLFAEWNDASPEDASVEYKKTSDSAYTAVDEELIRAKDSSTARVDIVGLEPGSYDVKITASDSTEITYTGVEVEEYDRSGYAHFNYTRGVGAYNDDGTLKDNAVVLYVTDENKDTVELPFPDDASHVVTGIGNILNSRGASGVSEGAANTNDGILLAYSKAGIPLDIRIIGTVTAPEGLTAYNSSDYGGTKGDNGYMARMRDAKDVTIEGIGTDASIYGWGIHFMASSAYLDYGESFEVRNITFESYPEDAVGMEGIQSGSTLTAPVERCWIHNCSFLPGYCANPAESDKSEGDGSCDFKRGQYYTMSYCYYYGCHKTNLIGASDSNYQFNISFHHNWWEDCESRGPLVRQANIHIYNNYYDGNTSKTMDTRASSYVLSENNYFDTCKNPITTKSNSAVKSLGDVFYTCSGTQAATVVTDREAVVSNNNTYPAFDTDPSLFYYNSLTKESDCYMTTAIVAKAECIAYSGVMKDVAVSAEVTTTIDTEPKKAMTIPYSIEFTAEDAGVRMTAANVSNLRGTNVEFENALYNAQADYKPSTSNGYLKSKGNDIIVFKLDEAAMVTFTCSDATTSSKYGVALSDNYGIPYATANVGETVSVNVPAGIYVFSCATATKECYIAGFSISEPGTIETTTETTTVSVVDYGTYKIGTDCTGDDDCSEEAGTYGNIIYDLNAIEADYGTINNNGDSGISFSIDKTMNLTVSSTGSPIIIEANSGKVNDEDSVTLDAGTNTVKLYAGTYTITGAESSASNIYSLVFAEYSEATTETTETTTETTTQSTPVATGTPTAEGTDCYVQDNGNGTYTLIDNSSTDTCVWTIPFTAQTSGKIVVSGNIALNKKSSKWPFLQIRGENTSGVYAEICGFGSDSDKVLALHDGTNYYSMGQELTANQTYAYEFIIDLDNSVATLTVDGTLTASCTIAAKNIYAIHMQTAVSATDRTVTADIPYVGILTESTGGDDDDETTTESSTETTTEDDGSLKGDVDGNGVLTANDAAVLLYYVINDETAANPAWNISSATADVDGDGSYSASDAAQILAKVLNMAYEYKTTA